MFIQSPDDTSLVFIQSNKINVFPCSRRRSTPISSGDSEYYIPFDPEARLNTEANNRKHSGLNGFKQSYIYDWNEDTGKLSMVLAGYLFDIQLGDTYSTPATFGNHLETTVFNGINPTVIYAKIKMAPTAFFSGGDGVPEATTKVLTGQFKTETVPNCLDLLWGSNGEQPIDNYYFTGLALTCGKSTTESENIIYLPVVKKDNGNWKVCESSMLPKVDHGSTANSVKVGLLEADSIQISGNSAASLTIGTNNGKPQLQFKFT